MNTYTVTGTDVIHFAFQVKASSAKEAMKLASEIGYDVSTDIIDAEGMEINDVYLDEE
jgi:hypothetical protein